MNKLALIALTLLLFGFVSPESDSMKIEDDMLAELNKARLDPPAYAEEILQYMRDEELTKSQKLAGFAIARQMKILKPMRPLEFNANLYANCTVQAKRMYDKNKFIKAKRGYAENIVYGYPEVKHAVIQLLINAEDKKKESRNNILNRKFTQGACKYVEGKVQEEDFVFIQAFDK